MPNLILYMALQSYFIYIEQEILNVKQEDIPEITKGDKSLEDKLKVLILEAEVMRQEGKSVPSSDFMKTYHWQELLKLDTRTARRRYLTFLFKTEMRRENIARKKEDRRKEREKTKPVATPAEEGEIKYGLLGNNIFLRFYDSTINNLYNNKLIQAMQFDQKIVIDCGFDKNMTNRENINCAKQLTLLFSDNRLHDQPFDIHYCNLEEGSTLANAFYRQIPTMYDDPFPINIHKESYLDLFSKEHLIYLTPHCREEMIEYDHEAIYIIGGIVDRTNNDPLSLAKAKKEGIRMLKLPLDRYLHWGAGSGKSLTINQVVSILLDIRKTGSWEYALRHVPRRKLQYETEQPLPNSKRMTSKELHQNNTSRSRYDSKKQSKSHTERKNLSDFRNIFE